MNGKTRWPALVGAPLALSLILAACSGGGPPDVTGAKPDDDTLGRIRLPSRGAAGAPGSAVPPAPAPVTRPDPGAAASPSGMGTAPMTGSAAPPAMPPPSTAPASGGGPSSDMASMPAPLAPAPVVMTTAPAAPADAPAPRTPAAYAPGMLKIPTQHPRLWWTPDRLARARAWVQANPLSPRADDPEGLALHYVLTGDAASARRAIDWLMGLTFPVDKNVSNSARWWGQAAVLVYDWCHDRMTDAERGTIIARWNTYVGELLQRPWGGPGMEGNNYYWGYLRNAILWGIASAHENPAAEGLLATALGDRWVKSFVPYADGAGRGGVPHEGSQYGRYILSYAAVPLSATHLLGFDMWDQSAFFREAVYYVIYASTPARTSRAGAAGRFELFPFNDDENFGAGGGAESPHLGGFMAAAVERWRGQPVAGHAQAWLDQVRPEAPAMTASVFQPDAARPLAELPLDYHAAGNDFLYLRDRWAPEATVVNLQLGRATAVGHEHMDWGTFQIWRGGRWLSRESTGYIDNIAGWRGGAEVLCNQTIAHNGVLFDGVGAPSIENRKGPPQLLRLESRQHHTFAAVDLSSAFRSNGAGRDNQAASRVIREFLFVRPLETLVVFDRLEASTPNVVKSFLVHFESAPREDGPSTVTGVAGDQALRVTTVAPAQTARRVVNEGGKVGQVRVEVEASGAAQTHFLNVLQAKGASDPDLNVAMTETASGYELTLTHPTRGQARVSLTKDATSTGGSFGWAPSGTPALTPLTSGVQTMKVMERGPVWQ